MTKVTTRLQCPNCRANRLIAVGSCWKCARCTHLWSRMVPSSVPPAAPAPSYRPLPWPAPPPAPAYSPPTVEAMPWPGFTPDAPSDDDTRRGVAFDDGPSTPADTGGSTDFGSSPDTGGSDFTGGGGDSDGGGGFSGDW